MQEMPCLLSDRKAKTDVNRFPMTRWVIWIPTGIALCFRTRAREVEKVLQYRTHEWSGTLTCVGKGNANPYFPEVHEAA